MTELDLHLGSTICVYNECIACGYSFDAYSAKLPILFFGPYSLVSSVLFELFSEVMTSTFEKPKLYQC